MAHWNVTANPTNSPIAVKGLLKQLTLQSLQHSPGNLDPFLTDRIQIEKAILDRISAHVVVSVRMSVETNAQCLRMLELSQL